MGDPFIISNFFVQNFSEMKPLHLSADLGPTEAGFHLGNAHQQERQPHGRGYAHPWSGIFDTFHIVRHLIDAVDQVRREEIREKGKEHKELIKRTRYL
jgi:hypothetical protein